MGTDEPIKTEISFEDLVIENAKSIGDEEISFTFEDIKNLDTNYDTKKSEESEDVEEEKKEDVTSEVETKEEAKTETKEENKEFNAFSQAAKKFIEKGFWKDVVIESEGKELKLSEIEELDEETFLRIQEEQQNFLKEELTEDSISVKDLDEDKKRIISIITNGGNLSDIFKDESELKRPYEGLDLEDQAVQQNILFNQYLRQGLSQEEAKELTIKATKDLTLDKKVVHIVDSYNKLYDENLKKIEEDLKQAKIKEAESIKEYKNNLIKSFKEDDLDEKLSNTLAEAATKYNKDGQLYIDSVYDEIMKDPAKAKDLIFFMLEKDKFLSAKGASIKRDVQVKNLKVIKLVSDTSKTENKVIEKDRPSSLFDTVVVE